MRTTVFVACHRDPIEVDADGLVQDHWLGEAIATTLKFYGVDLSKVDFYYGDIEAPRGRDDNGRYINADLLGDAFVSTHQRAFDFVFYPDCGGAWFFLQEAGNIGAFVALVQRLETLARRALVVSKLINDDARRYVELSSTYWMVPGEGLDYRGPYENPGPDFSGSMSHLYVYDQQQ